MLNIEKYKDEISECKGACELERLVCNLVGFRICEQFDYSCIECRGYILKWMFLEYKEDPKEE